MLWLFITTVGSNVPQNKSSPPKKEKNSTSFTLLRTFSCSVLMVSLISPVRHKTENRIRTTKIRAHRFVSILYQAILSPFNRLQLLFILTGKQNTSPGMLKSQKIPAGDNVLSKLSYRLADFCASILIPHAAQKPVYLSTKGSK